MGVHKQNPSVTAFDILTLNIGYNEKIRNKYIVGMPTDSASMENSIETSKKLWVEFPYDPVIPLLDIHKESKNINLKR